MIWRTALIGTALAGAVSVLAGCVDGEPTAGQASPEATTSPTAEPSEATIEPSDTSPPARPSPSSTNAPFTLTNLAGRPCRVVEALEDQPPEPPEENNKPWLEAKSCEWHSGFLGILVFTPFPSVDRTEDEELEGHERRQVGGREAVVAPGQERGVCHVYVSLGRGQSMRVLRGPVMDASAATEGACREAIDVAEQITAKIT